MLLVTSLLDNTITVNLLHLAHAHDAAAACTTHSDTQRIVSLISTTMSPACVFTAVFFDCVFFSVSQLALFVLGARFPAGLAPALYGQRQHVD